MAEGDEPQKRAEEQRVLGLILAQLTKQTLARQIRWEPGGGADSEGWSRPIEYGATFGRARVVLRETDAGAYRLLVFEERRTSAVGWIETAEVEALYQLAGREVSEPLPILNRLFAELYRADPG